MIPETSKNHDFLIKNDIILSTCTCEYLGHVLTDLNETWCHGSLVTDLRIDRLWSGELGFNLQKYVKTGVCVTVLLADAGFPLSAVTEECFAP